MTSNAILVWSVLMVTFGIMLGVNIMEDKLLSGGEVCDIKDNKESCWQLQKFNE